MLPGQEGSKEALITPFLYKEKSLPFAVLAMNICRAKQWVIIGVYTTRLCCYPLLNIGWGLAMCKMTNEVVYNSFVGGKDRSLEVFVELTGMSPDTRMLAIWMILAYIQWFLTDKKVWGCCQDSKDQCHQNSTPLTLTQTSNLPSCSTECYLSRPFQPLAAVAAESHASAKTSVLAVENRQRRKWAWKKVKRSFLSTSAYPTCVYITASLVVFLHYYAPMFKLQPHPGLTRMMMGSEIANFFIRNLAVGKSSQSLPKDLRTLATWTSMNGCSYQREWISQYIKSFGGGCLFTFGSSFAY